MSTAILTRLKAQYPTDDAASAAITRCRWPNGPTCPVCAGLNCITPRKNGFYRCNPCKIDFTIRTGTILARSKIPLHKWLYAMQVFVVAPNISSVQLGKQIGTTQKTAWYMLQRLKEVAPTDARLGSSTHEAYDAFVHAALHYPPLTICKRIDKKSQAV